MDGAANTSTIVAKLGPNGTCAAKVCSDYEVDDAGNTPYMARHTCYSGWLLPAPTQLHCLKASLAAIGGFSSDSILYWTSSEYPPAPGDDAEGVYFAGGGSLP